MKTEIIRSGPLDMGAETIQDIVEALVAASSDVGGIQLQDADGYTLEAFAVVKETLSDGSVCWAIRLGESEEHLKEGLE